MMDNAKLLHEITALTLRVVKLEEENKENFKNICHLQDWVTRFRLELMAQRSNQVIEDIMEPEYTLSANVMMITDPSTR